MGKKIEIVLWMTAGREGMAGKMKSIEEWKWGEEWKEEKSEPP